MDDKSVGGDAASDYIPIVSASNAQNFASSLGTAAINNQIHASIIRGDSSAYGLDDNWSPDHGLTSDDMALSKSDAMSPPQDLAQKVMQNLKVQEKKRSKFVP
jgi:hypothetical protein